MVAPRTEIEKYSARAATFISKKHKDGTVDTFYEQMQFRDLQDVPLGDLQGLLRLLNRVSEDKKGKAKEVTEEQFRVIKRKFAIGAVALYQRNLDAIAQHDANAEAEIKQKRLILHDMNVARAQSFGAGTDANLSARVFRMFNHDDPIKTQDAFNTEGKFSHLGLFPPMVVKNKITRQAHEWYGSLTTPEHRRFIHNEILKCEYNEQVRKGSDKAIEDKAESSDEGENAGDDEAGAPVTKGASRKRRALATIDYNEQDHTQTATSAPRARKRARITRAAARAAARPASPPRYDLAPLESSTLAPLKPINLIVTPPSRLTTLEPKYQPTVKSPAAPLTPSVLVKDVWTRAPESGERGSLYELDRPLDGRGIDAVLAREPEIIMAFYNRAAGRVILPPVG